MTKANGKLRRLAVLGVLLALLGGALPADAQQPPQGPRRMERGGPGPGPGYGPPPGHRGDAQRGMGPGEGQRGMGPGHGQRMSPEEREQLRRDISNHGRDVYRDRDRNGRRP